MKPKTNKNEISINSLENSDQLVLIQKINQLNVKDRLDILDKINQLICQQKWTFWRQLSDILINGLKDNSQLIIEKSIILTKSLIENDMIKMVLFDQVFEVLLFKSSIQSKKNIFEDSLNLMHCLILDLSDAQILNFLKQGLNSQNSKIVENTIHFISKETLFKKYLNSKIIKEFIPFINKILEVGGEDIKKQGIDFILNLTKVYGDDFVKKNIKASKFIQNEVTKKLVTWTASNNTSKIIKDARESSLLTEELFFPKSNTSIDPLFNQKSSRSNENICRDILNETDWSLKIQNIKTIKNILRNNKDDNLDIPIYDLCGGLIFDETSKVRLEGLNLIFYVLNESNKSQYFNLLINRLNHYSSGVVRDTTQLLIQSLPNLKLDFYFEFFKEGFRRDSENTTVIVMKILKCVIESDESKKRKKEICEFMNNLESVLKITKDATTSKVIKFLFQSIETVFEKIYGRKLFEVGETDYQNATDEKMEKFNKLNLNKINETDTSNDSPHRVHMLKIVHKNTINQSSSLFDNKIISSNNPDNPQSSRILNNLKQSYAFKNPNIYSNSPTKSPNNFVLKITKSDNKPIKQTNSNKPISQFKKLGSIIEEIDDELWKVPNFNQLLESITALIDSLSLKTLNKALHKLMDLYNCTNKKTTEKILNKFIEKICVSEVAEIDDESVLTLKEVLQKDLSSKESKSLGLKICIKALLCLGSTNFLILIIDFLKESVFQNDNFYNMISECLKMIVPGEVSWTLLLVLFRFLFAASLNSKAVDDCLKAVKQHLSVHCEILKKEFDEFEFIENIEATLSNQNNIGQSEDDFERMNDNIQRMNEVEYIDETIIAIVSKMKAATNKKTFCFEELLYSFSKNIRFEFKSQKSQKLLFDFLNQFILSNSNSKSQMKQVTNLLLVFIFGLQSSNVYFDKKMIIAWCPILMKGVSVDQSKRVSYLIDVQLNNEDIGKMVDYFAMLKDKSEDLRRLVIECMHRRIDNMTEDEVKQILKSGLLNQLLLLLVEKTKNIESIITPLIIFLLDFIPRTEVIKISRRHDPQVLKFVESLYKQLSDSKSRRRDGLYSDNGTGHIDDNFLEIDLQEYGIYNNSIVNDRKNGRNSVSSLNNKSLSKKNPSNSSSRKIFVKLETSPTKTISSPLIKSHSRESARTWIKKLDEINNVSENQTFDYSDNMNLPSIDHSSIEFSFLKEYNPIEIKQRINFLYYRVLGEQNSIIIDNVLKNKSINDFSMESLFTLLINQLEENKTNLCIFILALLRMIVISPVGKTDKLYSCVLDILAQLKSKLFYLDKNNKKKKSKLSEIEFEVLQDILFCDNNYCLELNIQKDGLVQDFILEHLLTVYKQRIVQCALDCKFAGKYITLVRKNIDLKTDRSKIRTDVDKAIILALAYGSEPDILDVLIGNTFFENDFKFNIDIYLVAIGCLLKRLYRNYSITSTVNDKLLRIVITFVTSHALKATIEELCEHPWRQYLNGLEEIRKVINSSLLKDVRSQFEFLIKQYDVKKLIGIIIKYENDSNVLIDVVQENLRWKLDELSEHQFSKLFDDVNISNMTCQYQNNVFSQIQKYIQRKEDLKETKKNAILHDKWLDDFLLLRES